MSKDKIFLRIDVCGKCSKAQAEQVLRNLILNIRKDELPNWEDKRRRIFREDFKNGGWVNVELTLSKTE